jgi:hypothetical protein
MPGKPAVDCSQAIPYNSAEVLPPLLAELVSKRPGDAEKSRPGSGFEVL